MRRPSSRRTSRSGTLQLKRKEIYDRVQIMILDNVPHIWLYSADTIDFTQASVKGFRQHPTTQLYGLEGAWIERA